MYLLSSIIRSILSSVVCVYFISPSPSPRAHQQSLGGGILCLTMIAIAVEARSPAAGNLVRKIQRRAQFPGPCGPLGAGASGSPVAPLEQSFLRGSRRRAE